ncbi:hypothetical protein AB0E63_33100 [Kribbella sp. NPDC026596]|uniref:hypothetical protein n=1 Tax=Kribbella sp. NPDC026596 TaxID=3155122 RepID=UPI0034009F27
MVETLGARPLFCDLLSHAATSLEHNVSVGAVYPAANPPPTLAQVYLHEPDLAGARPIFLPTMKRLLAAIAAGLRTVRP